MDASWEAVGLFMRLVQYHGNQYSITETNRLDLHAVVEVVAALLRRLVQVGAAGVGPAQLAGAVGVLRR